MCSLIPYQRKKKQYDWSITELMRSRAVFFIAEPHMFVPLYAIFKNQDGKRIVSAGGAIFKITHWLDFIGLQMKYCNIIGSDPDFSTANPTAKTFDCFKTLLPRVQGFRSLQVLGAGTGICGAGYCTRICKIGEHFKDNLDNYP